MPDRKLRERPTGADDGRLRILIVDDSAVARAVIARAIEANPRFRVSGSVPHAAAALGFLKENSVDGIVLDIEMPGVTGLDALPDLISEGRGAKVLIVSSSCGDGATATLEALSLGAADTLVKPEVGDFAGRFSGQLVEKLARLCDRDPSPEVAGSIPSRSAAEQFEIIAIGASTGGIHALKQMLAEVPASVTMPILVTQHLPESFMPYFAAQLAVLARRPCDIAEDHMRVRPGRIIIAPGDAHIRVVSTGEGCAVRLSNKPAASGCVPSVDPMFDSVAELFGPRALAVVLSGMGRDGSLGAATIAKRGGSVVVQDQESSVVWGMPGSVAVSGNAHAILPPAEIGKLIAARKRPS
ncbi:chemotaxis-specific protein-glutamate methyltransferase CheB [Sphingomonas immobilis]|uniref:protein-glutamate methylesterase n=1 Tax=Sphingomonas immobilis TaxID=3063997 RepID=A0ABT8ZZ33_9SPHN|nr:chemotaxis-specific protein-glutamate methyltransferase CheB [Sphingomonas sp. CA1-15]MDO7842843.1 chemotaxis-specific protein-glutamate methyltransferase CheB [Sphingomonas sp. CA1-15]